MQPFKSLRPALIAFSLLPTLASQAQLSFPYDAVNPIIGTDGGGNTFPGATLPFGMIQWSPDTNTDAWYYQHDKQITGFSLTHVSGAGCPLYGDFAVLPIPGELTTSPGSAIAPYAATFDHSNEEAHPGYYAITLANGIRVEITVAERSGIARLTFPAGTPARLMVNAGSSANTRNPKQAGSAEYGNQIELDTDSSYTGSVSAGGFCSSDSHYKLYVTGQFSKPYKTAKLWQDDAILPDAKSAQGKHTGAWLDFGSEREVILKVGISFVSQEGASANLQKEIPAFDFGHVHAEARRIWSEQLDRVAVVGGTPDQRTIFSTGVYHSLLSPNLFSDEDGNYAGFDNQVHSLAGSTQKAQYANFSDWDIYRNTVQFQALLDPARESDIVQSLVNDAVQSGWYPRWPAANDVTYVMGGDSPVAVIASSYAFGAHNFDVSTALQYMIKAATQPGIGPHKNSERPFLDEYLKLGYSPVDKDEIAASRTLEYSNDDFAIAQFARNIGLPSEYRQFLAKSRNWKNLLDPTTQWIRPRNADGSWEPDFDSERSLPKRHWNGGLSNDQLGFEEGNTWQYSFMIPFDYPALFAAMGGEDKVIPRLDRFFLKLRCWGEPCYNIENEPDFVVPYAYVFAGQPWKTQEVVTRIGKEVFKNAPDGIPGNDDLGATSGVYVWDALGFYPAIPGVGGVVLGTPMFDKTTLRLSGGRKLIVSRIGEGIYVQKVTLDGAEYPNSWLPLDKLHPGTTQLDFTVAPTPNKQRGAAIADRPPSFR
ncbi:MAG: GH92 family glycosyl hydrolase [Terracidiphilus sp.]|jgi:predicted alpha-1,2-mannosidase